MQVFKTFAVIIIIIVDVDGVTWHGANGEETMVDHIFVPKNWQVENTEIIDLKGTSDHEAICVDVKRR